MSEEHPDFDQGRLLALITEQIDGELDGAAHAELSALLKASPEARAFYRQRMELHAALHREAEQFPTVVIRPRPKPQQYFTRGNFIACAAVFASLVILAAAFLRWAPTDTTFATIESVQSARWESSDQGISKGARIGAGSFHLSEGLATIHFDSGAEVTLEGPTEIELVDAMNCKLPAGIIDVTVPRSAHGYAVETPWTRVIDQGTHFSVTVDPTVGSTRTSVYEGRVQVDHIASGQSASLTEGQGNAATESGLGSINEDSEQSTRKIGASQSDEANWTRLESSKDAYIGAPGEHVSDTLLLIKNGEPARQAYLGFDLSDIDPKNIAGAELRLHFAPSGFGMAAFVPDSTFSVHGLTRTGIAWNGRGGSVENLKRLESESRKKLGSFVVPQGVQRGEFKIEGAALAEFIQKNAGSEITLLVVRDTPETEGNGLVHGIASRRHPSLPAPTLAIQPAR